jgi:transposase
MKNKDLTAGEREALFILKNENKTYSEIAKLLKISKISVYYTLKNFGPTSFSSHKNQSGRRRKTSKNDDDRIVIISKQNRHLTASDITSEMNQSQSMYAYCICRSQIWIHRSRGLFPLLNCPILMIFA